MATFQVTMKEVHNRYIELEAPNREEALRMVEDGEDDKFLSDETEYNYTLERDHWEIHEIKNDTSSKN